RMEIGRMVEASLQNEREICKKEILDSLIPLAEDNKVNNTYGEIMILSAAFLVNKDKEPEFDQKVQGLGTQYGDKIKFKYVGTLPPFNFVNLVIETGKY
ncbi:MAG: GvpL/GvpF family gas vesicle protein, partial [Bacteroidetes bacterium]|nr:GvpL/GvpF family gas vesicle protein [Bacteroidota bacterium]